MDNQKNNALRAEIEKQGVPLAGLSRDLLQWYDKHARILPGASGSIPRLGIGNMLQQTRVEAVRPYFERFMEALPTVEALADAPEEVLLKLWEGLGYYNRARNLQRAARIVVTEYGGVLPNDYGLLLSLPGVGEYTAGAIASIAYGIAVPAVDGNVLRVLSRLLASEADIAQPKVKAVFREIAADMQPPARPGDYNQAMMELGATVCVPISPRCAACPVAHGCVGRQLGCAATLPVKSPKRKGGGRTEPLSDPLRRASADSEAGGRGCCLVCGNFRTCKGDLSVEQAVRQMEEWGIQTDPPQLAGEAKHVFTHVEWRMARIYKQGPAQQLRFVREWLWATVQLQTHAMPSAFRYYRDAARLWRRNSADGAG
ncbi:MAG: A/G-specific adenine glycosylase [Oscillospiraceae bacterium]